MEGEKKGFKEESDHMGEHILTKRREERTERPGHLEVALKSLKFSPSALFLLFP